MKLKIMLLFIIIVSCVTNENIFIKLRNITSSFSASLLSSLSFWIYNKFGIRQYRISIEHPDLVSIWSMELSANVLKTYVFQRIKYVYIWTF